MKKWLLTWIAILTILCGPVFGEEIFKPQTSNTGIIGGQANEYWRQGNFGRLLLPERAAGDISGNPPSNFGWLYVKDKTGASALYFESDSGAVTEIGGVSATAWDDIGDPDANKTITFGTYTQKFTNAGTVADMFTFEATAAFGDVSIVLIEQKTGNPTNGTALEIKLADTDVDFVSFATGGVEKVNITSGGAVTLAGGLTATTGTFSGAVGTGALTPAGTLAMAANAITGTTGTITYSNWSISAGGAATFVSMNAGTLKQDALIPASATPTTITLNGAGAGGVTIGGTSTGTITLGGGSTLVDLPANTDMILSGGTLGITDTGNGPTLSVTNNTITNTNLLTLSAIALTSGKGLSFTVGNVLTGALFYGGYTDGAGITGKLFELYNGAGDVFKIERYGKTTIAGSATGTDAFVITAGDITVTDGKITQAGGAVSFNNNSNFAVSIAIGTSIGAVTIGGGSNTVAVNSTVWDVGTDGAFTGVKSIAMVPNVATSISLGTNGAAQDFTVQVTGATDSSLVLASSGTGADALQITASAGGIAVSANLAAANQFYVSAAGTVAGYAINLATTNGGITLNAAGAANGDILIQSADAMTLTVGGNGAFNATGTLALSSSDWGITTTGVMTKIASISFDSSSVIYYDTVSISNAEIKALRAAPKQLVAAPGAAYFLELVSAVLIMDYGTNVFTVNAADDLVIQYNTTGVDATASIETTGFLTAAADTMCFVPASNAALIAVTAANVANRALELFNTGGAEIGGNAGADTVMKVKIAYRIHPTNL